MSQPSSIEPGLLPAYRLLALVPIVAATLVFLLSLLGLLPLIGDDATLPTYGRFTGSFVACFLCALLYLCWPNLPQRLGRLFLPIALSLSSLGPLVIFATILSVGNTLDAASLVIVLSPASFYLLVPIVLIAWQYTYRAVVFYSLLIILIKFLIVWGIRRLGVPLVPGVARFLIEQLVIFLSIGALAARLIQSQRRQRAELATANAKLVAYANTLEQLTVSRERNAMARELHDTVAHYFSGLVLQLEGARLLWEAEPAEAKHTLDQAINTVRSGLNETRLALHALRANVLEDLGLLGALRQLAHTIAERAGATLDLQLPSTLPIASPAVEQTLYRIAQESLTNCERHANAKTLRLALCEQAGQLILAIQDDGSGFDLTEAETSNRLGLKGMHERAELVAGRLQIDSAVGQGTRVRLVINGVHNDSSSAMR